MSELNLLPPLRRALQLRQLKRGLVACILDTLLWSASAVLLVGIIAFLAMLTLVGLQPDDARLEYEQTAQSAQTLQRGLAAQQALLEQVDRVSQERLVWSDFLSELFKVVPSGVLIAEIGTQQGVVDTAADGTTQTSGTQVTVMGQAINRGAVILFNDKLKSLSGVTEVIAPHTNLIDKDNPIYHFTLHLAALQVGQSARATSAVTNPAVGIKLPTAADLRPGSSFALSPGWLLVIGSCVLLIIAIGLKVIRPKPQLTSEDAN